MKSNPPSSHLKKSCLLAGLLSSAMLFASAANGAEATASTDLTTHCSECHGSDGLGTKSGVPHIDGQPASVLSNMISALQQGTRPSTAKAHRDVTATAIAALAKHYAQQKPQRPKSVTNPELVSRGEALYLKRCSACHVDNGRDSAREAPLLAAQNADYLVSQMTAFTSGQRKFPFLMDEAYRDLSPEDLTAISHFFAAQDQIAPQQGRKRRR